MIPFFRSTCFVALLTLVVVNCAAQSESSRDTFVTEFNWTIKIPAGFEALAKSDVEKMKNRGMDALEKTVGAEITDYSTLIFSFRSNIFDYFEANYQHFDTKVDGNYEETSRLLGDVIYETFRTQMPDAKIDTARSVEMIDNLEFLKFHMKIVLSPKATLNMLMYDKLFENKFLTLNIMYIDEEKGEQLISAW